MRSEAEWLARAASPATVGGQLQLGAVATELYADLRLTPVLKQLLDQSRRMLGAMAGSISLVDSGRDRYAKMAEHGASCRLGQSFPLAEGVTGAVMASRQPVVLDRYSDIAVGHLPEAHPANRGAVAAVPIWWRGDIIGANVVFAGRRRHYTAAEVDELEMLTHVAAAGIVQAGAGDASLGNLILARTRARTTTSEVRTQVSEVGPARPVSPKVADVAVALVTLSEQAAARRSGSAKIHVAVVYGQGGLRLLVQDEGVDAATHTSTDPLGVGTRSWHDLVASGGGAASIERVAGWGSLVRVDLPYETAPSPPRPVDQPSPLTTRESEVLSLVSLGLSNSQLARRLAITPKTVEKHVGAILRKTGSNSRTGATMVALERGWLSRVAAPHAS